MVNQGRTQGSDRGDYIVAPSLRKKKYITKNITSQATLLAKEKV